MLNFFKPSQTLPTDDAQQDRKATLNNDTSIHKNELNEGMDIETNNTYRAPFANEISLLNQSKRKEISEIKRRYEEHIESTKQQIEAKKKLIMSGGGSIGAHSDLNDLVSLSKTLTGNLEEQLKRISKKYDDSMSEVRQRFEDKISKLQSKK